jgi:hypothetical protein
MHAWYNLNNKHNGELHAIVNFIPINNQKKSFGQR